MRLGMVAVLYFHGPKQRDPETLGLAIRKAREEGLALVSGGISDWRNGAHIEQTRRLLDETGIELELGFAYNYCSDEPDIHARKRDESAAFVSEACVPLGVSTVGTCPVGIHRRSPSPPLDEQIDRSAAVLKGLAQIAAQHDIRLAVENHADYRGHEIAAIIRKAGEPNLGARLDTGNPFWVFEEPVDAARALAPYTITTHIKDLAVAPFARWEGVPLGRGHVDLSTIIAELADRTPDPSNLPLIMEVEGLARDTDVTAAADASLHYLRSAFTDHLA